MGQAQSGKDSVALHLGEHGFKKMSFAAKLKQVCKELFMFEDAQLETTNGKAIIDPRYDLTPRTVLQKVGIFFRELYKDIWVDYLMSEIDGPDIKNWDGSYSNIVITDVRFLNEVKAVKERNGVIIRLIREDYQALQGKEAQHASETEQLNVPDELIDLTVSAKTGELEKLYKDVTDFLLKKAGR